MKKKKSEKANLEKNRLIYFEAGLIIALSLSLVAFEWSKAPSEINAVIGLPGCLIEHRDQTEVTFRKNPK